MPPDPNYKTPDELEYKINEYLDETDHLTITGLALHLGFCSRQSMYDYEKKDGFSYIIKRAKLRIEQQYEEHLTGNNVAGSIFVLKNMGWSDKSEIDNTHSFTTRPVINFTDNSKK